MSAAIALLTLSGCGAFLKAILLGRNHDASQTSFVASFDTHCLCISNLVEMFASSVRRTYVHSILIKTGLF
jgi:hypothetical protein